MYENTPGYPPPPPPSSGMGCFAKGCLTVLVIGVLLTVMLGGFGWYVMHSVVSPFLSDRPASIRVRPVTDEEYAAVQQKSAPFVQAMKAGRAASLSLTADDLNALIARDASPDSPRGKIFLAIDHNTITADVSYPIEGKQPPARSLGGSPTSYFNGRVIFDASFADGEFTFVPRKLEPLGGGATPGMITWFLDNPGFSRGFNRSFNDGFRKSIDRNPDARDFIDRLQTVIVQNNEVIVTTAASATPVAVPSS